MHWYVNYPESEPFFTPMHNVDFSYPAHLHGCMEVSFCVAGEVWVTVEGTKFFLSPAQGILIPPNTVHSYDTPASSEYYTILFSQSLMPSFSGLFAHKRPERYVFPVEEPLFRQLREFYGSERTVWGAKALLYRMAEAFLRGNAFQSAPEADAELTRRIITYIQDNLCREVTLGELADHLGYSYYYVSKRIGQVFGASFTTLLAQYRVARVKMLLETGKYTVIQAALDSGFGSVRSFNRVFLELTGLTPSQYLATSSHSETLK